MKTISYFLGASTVVSKFKEEDGAIVLKKVITAHDKDLPCKMTILQWRAEQIKEIIKT